MCAIVNPDTSEELTHRLSLRFAGRYPEFSTRHALLNLFPLLNARVYSHSRRVRHEEKTM